MSQTPVVVQISLCPGFSLAVKLICWAALAIALLSPTWAERFVVRATSILPRLFVRLGRCLA